jgi:ribonuclease-3
MMHSSIAETNEKGIKESYERLEYLGDAVLGLVVAEYLYSQYPFKEEGFLTEIRSKIVSREALNSLAQKIGLKELVQYNQQNRTSKSVYGDALEALIGAVHLDHNFKFCRQFVINKLIKPHYDLNELITTVSNFKSKLLEWSQKENIELRFEIIDEEDRKFTAQVFLDGKPKSKGYGFSKKKAEQDAARKTYLQLNLPE